MDCDWKGQVFRIVGGGIVVIHSSGETSFSFTHNLFIKRQRIAVSMGINVLVNAHKLVSNIII